MIEMLPIKDIKQDITLQPRAKMDSVIIAEYTESLKAGDKFPPVIVYNVSGEFFLVDGYHRLLALKSARITKVEVDIRDGTMRDATLFSAGVNATHGIRRSNEDKRRAVMILLRDPEWGKWANAAIAKACNVSVDLVSSTHDSILGETDRCRAGTSEPTPEKRKVKRAGKVFEMDTSKIGKKEPKKLEPEQCASPQPGSIPVTDAPPIKSMGEISREKEELPPQLPETATMAERLKRDAAVLKFHEASDKTTREQKAKTLEETLNAWLTAAPSWCRNVIAGAVRDDPKSYPTQSDAMTAALLLFSERKK